MCISRAIYEILADQRPEKPSAAAKRSSAILGKLAQDGKFRISRSESGAQHIPAILSNTSAMATIS